MRSTYTWRKIRKTNFTFFSSGFFGLKSKGDLSHFAPQDDRIPKSTHPRFYCNIWFVERIDDMRLPEEALLIAIVVLLHQPFLVPFEVIQENPCGCGWYLKAMQENGSVAIIAYSFVARARVWEVNAIDEFNRQSWNAMSNSTSRSTVVNKWMARSVFFFLVCSSSFPLIEFASNSQQKRINKTEFGCLC